MQRVPEVQTLHAQHRNEPASPTRARPQNPQERNARCGKRRRLRRVPFSIEFRKTPINLLRMLRVIGNAHRHRVGQVIVGVF